eukprot:5086697-Prymnesium_polylepis.1
MAARASKQVRMAAYTHLQSPTAVRPAHSCITPSRHGTGRAPRVTSLLLAVGRRDMTPHACGTPPTLRRLVVPR